MAPVDDKKRQKHGHNTYYSENTDSFIPDTLFHRNPYLLLKEHKPVVRYFTLPDTPVNANDLYKNP